MKENAVKFQKELLEYQNMMQKLLVPVLITSKKSRIILYANEYASNQYETTLDELIGSHIDSVYLDVDQKEKIFDNLNEDGIVDSLEMNFKTFKGNVFTGLLSLIDITYNDEDCFFGLVKDITIQKKQREELKKLNNELDTYKNELESLVELEVAKREEGEKIILQQAKHAAMGEMIDAVAHQWKQPISIMSLQVETLLYQHEFEGLNDEELKRFKEKFTIQKELMLETLNEFRNFLRPNKNIQNFSIKNCIKSVSLLLKDEMISNQIQIEQAIEHDFDISSVENEFKHTIINILNNAKDAFKTRINEYYKAIQIYTIFNENEKKLFIEDNAGGIPLHIIDDIFKANITSKEDSGGTGIGLYMTKQILDKFNIFISCENIENGARFIFDFAKNDLILE